MNLAGVVHLGIRYLGRNRGKTALLVAAFVLVWLLPAGVALMVDKVESQLRARAHGTPLVLGQAGSPLELVFNSLYFAKPGIATLRSGDVVAIDDSGLGAAIPLSVRFSSNGFPIVGTTLDYFDLHGLSIREGGGLTRLGECVVGAEVAERLGVRPGDSLVSSPETLFDLAGVYPLKMHIVGVLGRTGSPDDSAIFVDLKTVWIIEGLGHGHEDAEKLDDSAKLAPNAADGETVRLNASVVQYREVTEENEDDFHFHGEMDDYPITAAIVVPADAKGQALLKGRYGKPGGLQLIAPSAELDELFATVFRVQDFVLKLLVAIGAATLLIGGLVFLLSHRLRRDEFDHLRHLGADPATLRALIGFEAVFVLVASLVVAAAGLGVLSLLAPWMVELGAL